MTGFGRLLREPLLHFFAAGAALFALFAVLDGGTSPAPGEIVVDRARVADLTGQFQRVWQRPPSEVELQGLIDSWVREEILYREGVALGLDRDDPVLRRRIAQKMTFISEDLLSEEPTEADLEAWLDDHPEDYRIEPVVSFQQIYLDPEAGPVEPRVAAIRQALAAGAPARGQGDGTLLPPGLDDASMREVARTFGSDFAEALVPLPLDSWGGPIRSGYGLHLVRLSERQPGRAARLEDVRGAVLRDLQHARAREANDRFYAELRERYDVRLVGVPGAAPAATADSSENTEGGR